MKNKSRLTQNPIRSIHTKSNLKTPADCTMETMRGMIADKTPRIRRLMIKPKTMVITIAEDITGTITANARRTDVPNQTAVAIVADPAAVIAQAVLMSTIT